MMGNNTSELIEEEIRLSQQQIEVSNITSDAVINSVAGSGKTTALIELCKNNRDKNILYIAYNRTVREHAVLKMREAGLSNVRVETAHSLAYSYIVRGNWYRVSQNFNVKEVYDALNLSGKDMEFSDAKIIKELFDTFCNITDAEYIKYLKENYKKYISFVNQLYWAMDSGKIPISHDFYLKKFQMSNPKLEYDFILFDEGQDASPVMLDIVEKQDCTKVVVGDSSQQIYSWRHAVDSLQSLDYKKYYLDKSFRFGKNIAEVANEILNYRDKALKLGNKEFKSVRVIGTDVPNNSGGSYAKLSRSNIRLLREAIEIVYESNKTIYIQGDINSYLYSQDGVSLYDVLNLYLDKHENIRNYIVKSMKSISELKEYCEDTGDRQVRTMVILVEEFGARLFRMIKDLRNRIVTDEEESDVILSTVHKAKGLEYDIVELLSEDFITESEIRTELESKDDTSEKNLPALIEEINILYVAVTRAKKKLIIPAEYLPFGKLSNDNVKIV